MFMFDQESATIRYGFYGLILMDRPNQTLGLVKFRLRAGKWLGQILWSKCIGSDLFLGVSPLGQVF